jgi:predicted permease
MSASSRPRKLETFLLQLRKELAARFRVDARHPGIERILEETEAHLDDAISALLDQGVAAEEAAAQALERFGSVSRIARAYGFSAPSFVDRPGCFPRLRKSRVFSSLSEWLSDLRIVIRGLKRSPGYLLAFVLTLGLGIGANTAIFSVIYGVWIRPLPYRDGDRIVYLRQSATGAGMPNATFSVPEIEDYRSGSRSFQDVAEFSVMIHTMLGVDEPKRVRAGIVTGNYFEVMGLGAHLGRVITERDDGAAAPAVGVLTYDYWHRVFGADPSAVGRTIEIDDRSVLIVGVAEPAPPYPEETNLYLNMVASPHHLSASMTQDRVHRMTEAFARLAPDATLESARAEVDAVTERIHKLYPEAYDETSGFEVSVIRLRDQLAAEARPTMLMLLGVAVFVLLIACANVANLTLTRMMRRYDEWALRVSLGAKPFALRRQLFIECTVPSIAGAALGVLLAVAGVGLLASYIARYSARASEISVDLTVLLVALVVALASASFFAFLPRLPGTGPRRLGWLSGARSTAGVSSRRLQKVLVVSQIGVSFVLLVGAGLLLETLRKLQRDDGGVALDEVLVMNVPISYGAFTPQELLAHHGRILEGVSALPGVRSAALGSMVPLRETPRGVLAGLASLEFEIEGQPTAPGTPPPRADFRVVSGGYFRTLGMTLLRGRTFEAIDTPDSAKVVVVNQALAERYFEGRDPLGQRIGWRGETLHFMGVTQEYRTIVGVVSDVKDYGVAEAVPYVAFNPVTEVPLAGSLFVRTAQPDSIVRPIRDLIHDIDPQQPVIEVGTLARVRSESISPQRLNAALVGIFAFLALTVAAVGVASVLAFGVSQRTHEFGVRAALGADRSRLMHIVLKEGALLVVLGVGIGLAASFFFGGLLSGMLHDVRSTDPGTLGFVAILLTFVALLASAIPAWRASEIDPVQALWEE